MRSIIWFSLVLTIVGSGVARAQVPETRELRIAEVSAPDINCISDLDCRITVRDRVGDFHITQNGVLGRLQSRTSPRGESGTAAEGLYPYSYRVMIESSSRNACIHRIEIPGIEPVPVDMDGDGAEDDIYFVSRGGIGSVAPSNAVATEGGISIELGNGVCGRQSTYFIGLFSEKQPTDAMASIHSHGTLFSEVDVVTSTLINELPTVDPTHPVVPVDNPAPLDLALDKVFYDNGDAIAAELVYSGSALIGDVQGVLLVSSATEDVEHLVMRSNDSGISFQSTAESIVRVDLDSVTDQFDGKLSTQPGDTIVAFYYVNKVDHPEIEQSIVSDLALIKKSSEPAPSIRIEPRLAQWNAADSSTDQRAVGAFVVRGRAPIQVASQELLFWPTDNAQLQAFIDYSGGTVLDSQARDPANPSAAPGDRVYRVGIDTERAESSLLPELRKLYGESQDLMVSSDEVSSLYALLLEYKLQGYQVYANAKLEFNAAPTVVENALGRSNLNHTMKRRVWNGSTMTDCTGDSNCTFNVPDLWSYMALWDADETEVSVGFLDMGFIGEHPDFRHPRSGAPIRECDFEADSEGNCGPGRASSPPTVGNGFTGSRSWHGTGVVTVAGGVVNNDWLSSAGSDYPGGAAGVGGQVVVPMLYRFGTSSYLFEMGAGIIQAVDDGASCINISAGYPCNLQTSVLPDVDLCVPGGRGLICAEIFGILSLASAAICSTAVATSFIPIVGPIIAAPIFAACAVATTAAAASIPACAIFFASVGDIRSPMQAGVDYATANGVPVITSTGNLSVVTNLPDWLQEFIDTDNIDTNDWNIIPAVFDNTLAVGSVNEGTLLNNNFTGEALSTWAPIRSPYFAPDSKDALPTSVNDLERKTIGGTSAAAPYVAGLVAAMQALDPSLNPRTPGLSRFERASIPNRIRSIITGTATRTGLPTDPNRRNLVNPLAAIQRVGRGVLPNLSRYDLSLDFDDNDTESSPALLRFGTASRGTIVAMRGGPNTGLGDGTTAPTRADTDWYEFNVPSARGLYQTRVGLTVPDPERFDWLSAEFTKDSAPTSVSISSETTTRLSETETRIDYVLDALPPGASVLINVKGRSTDDDNVYRIEVDNPINIDVDADIFDVDAPPNPDSSRPNNNTPERAVELGGSRFPWRFVRNVPFDGEQFEIRISDLNFHQIDDLDWFKILELPSSPRSSSSVQGCNPVLELEYDFGVEFVASANSSGDAASTTPLRRDRSFHDLETVGPMATVEPLWIKLERSSTATGMNYEFVLRFFSATRSGFPC